MLPLAGLGVWVDGGMGSDWSSVAGDTLGNAFQSWLGCECSVGRGIGGGISAAGLLRCVDGVTCSSSDESLELSVIIRLGRFLLRRRTLGVFGDSAELGAGAVDVALGACRIWVSPVAEGAVAPTAAVVEAWMETCVPVTAEGFKAEAAAGIEKAVGTA